MTGRFISVSRRMADATGERFGALTVLGPVGRNERGQVRWAATCDCGGEAVDYIWNLRRNTSCGCHRSARMVGLRYEHGHNRKSGRSRTHLTWESMIARCENPKHDSFEYYGARGIKVCQHWRDSFAAFLADMGERPVGMTIDRLENEGDYNPGNCRWATAVEQRASRRDVEMRCV